MQITIISGIQQILRAWKQMPNMADLKKIV